MDLFRPVKSLFAFQKIPVPKITGIGMQTIEITSEFSAEKPPRGLFSCKIPVKIPVSRDFLRGFQAAVAGSTPPSSGAA
jgi:hypothetical protein